MALRCLEHHALATGSDIYLRARDLDAVDRLGEKGTRLIDRGDERIRVQKSRFPGHESKVSMLELETDRSVNHYPDSVLDQLDSVLRLSALGRRTDALKT